jgi:hypothetical protein
MKVIVAPRRRKTTRKRRAVEEDPRGREEKQNQSFDIAAQIMDEESGATPLKYNTAKTYISAVMDLYNQQIARGNHSYPNPRGFGVRGHLSPELWDTIKLLRGGTDDPTQSLDD